MNDVGVGEVVGVLHNDKTLTLEAELFYIQLKFQNDRRADIIEEHQERFEWAQLLTTIITQYAVEKGALATVGSLGDVLSEMGHVETKDILIARFGESSRIVAGENEVNLDDIRRYEDTELQENTAPSAISIFQLLPTQNQPNQRRLAVVVTHLLNILKEIGDRPVAIISINGKQRSGKSFLATQFIKYLTFGQGEQSNWLDGDLVGSFQWRDDYERVTSGIQIWHKPFFVNHEGREIGVIVMDTQGLHDSRTASHENSLIFGLSALLSSIFIYNERHSGDDSLQYLHSFLEFARFASAGENGASQGQLKFQNLILLCRDWQSDRQFKFGYYEDNLCPSGQIANLKNKVFDITTRMSKQAIKTRQGISQSFDKIGVYALSGYGAIRPDNEEYRVSTRWDRNFREGIEDISKLLFSPGKITNKVKTVLGEEISAKDLMPFVVNYATQIQNSERAIESKSIFESTAELYYNRKMEIGINNYKKKQMDYLQANSTGVSVEAFELNNINLVGEIIAEFLAANALGGERMKAEYAKELKKDLEGEKAAFLIINEANRAAEQHKRDFAKAKKEADDKEAKFQLDMLRLRNENKVKEERLKLEMQNAKNDHEKQQLQLKIQIEKERHEAQMREAEAERKRQEAIHQAALEKAAMEARMEQERLAAQAREAALQAQAASGRRRRKRCVIQ